LFSLYYTGNNEVFPYFSNKFIDCNYLYLTGNTTMSYQKITRLIINLLYFRNLTLRQSPSTRNPKMIWKWPLTWLTMPRQT